MSTTTKFTCLCCRIKVQSAELQRSHFKSEWHLYNLKRRVCELDPVDLEYFEANAHLLKPAEDEDTDLRKTLEEDHEDLWENLDEQEDEEELDDEEQAEHEAKMLENVVGPTTCLFCSKNSVDIEGNVEHMHHHGFFIPEEQYLTDLEGLIVYLGYKVGAGTICLWCHKQFKSVHGVRLHMLYKSHCKIRYDHEDALEFSDFYDYSTQEKKEMMPLSQLVKRRSEKYLEAKQSRALAIAESKNLKSSNHKAIVLKTHSFVTPEYVKKFNSKILLKTGMANNQTMRSRLRKQNPM